MFLRNILVHKNITIQTIVLDSSDLMKFSKHIIFKVFINDINSKLSLIFDVSSDFYKMFYNIFKNLLEYNMELPGKNINYLI